MDFLKRKKEKGTCYIRNASTFSEFGPFFFSKTQIRSVPTEPLSKKGDLPGTGSIPLESRVAYEASPLPKASMESVTLRHRIFISTTFASYQPKTTSQVNTPRSLEQEKYPTKGRNQAMYASSPLLSYCLPISFGEHQELVNRGNLTSEIVDWKICNPLTNKLPQKYSFPDILSAEFFLYTNSTYQQRS